MGIGIRSADLDRDRDLLISALSAHLTPHSDQRRFEWLYIRGPEGTARAWIAFEEDTERVIGASAAFPRRIEVNGCARKAWVLGDFCISNEYRSLGPALQLQRATLRGVDDGEVEFCYDFPSRQMEAIYRRMGIPTATQFVRMSKPLLVNAKVQSLLGKNVFASALSSTANSALRIGHRLRNRREWAFEIHTDKFDDRFSDLYLHSTDGQCGYGVRSADYLNWRFLEHANVRYQVLTALCRGSLEAFAVFSTTDRVVEINEMGAKTEEALSGLLKHLTATASRSQMDSINTFVTLDDPRRRLLERHGFWNRESSPVVVYWPKLQSQTANALSWNLTQADRDS